MTDLTISFFTSLIGGGAGIGVVVFALSKWLGSVWKEHIGRLEDARITIETLQKQATIDTIAREHTANLEERLKLIEQNHERSSTKEEHFHQISQETYQKLFDRKISVYDELMNLSMELYRVEDSVYRLNNQREKTGLDALPFALHSYSYGYSYENFSDKLRKNLTVLSPQLMESFIKWDKFFSLTYSQDMKGDIENRMNEVKESIENKTLEELKNKLIEKHPNSSLEKALTKGIIIQSHFEDLKIVLDQIRKDVQLLNKQINR